MSEQAPGVEALVGKIEAGEAPDRIRAAAARGALPLPRAVLVRLFLLLLDDPVDEIREAARASLQQLDAAAVKEVLADPGCAAEVLRHYAEPGARDAAIAEGIVFHPTTPVEALEVLAATGSAPVLDLVLTNQQRLLASPQLLEKLMGNPALGPAQRARILEILDRASRAKPVQADRAEQDTDGADTAEDGVEGFEDAAALLDVDVGELLSASEIIDGEEFAQSEDVQIRGAYERIVTLNTAQKAILAMKGGREERMILIRDSNKIVCSGVIRNPRLTDNEVEAIAKMRNVSEDILRQVGNKREWVKQYSVVLGLIHNPRTPPTISSNLVKRLSNRDLRNLVRNREVPELLRRMARNTYEVRTKPAASLLRKK